MQCAVTAAKRGHDVILCEKSDSLGGALKAERGIPFKADLFRFIEVKSLQMKRGGVDIRLNTVVTPELVEELSPHAVIVAAGSQAQVPPLPGIEKAIMADNLPDFRDKLGKRVAILGGGLVGCETAVHLVMEGHDVTVVEMQEDICIDANPRHRPLLLAELERQNVNCLTETRAISVTDEGLVCVTPTGEILVSADSVVCAAGRVPNSDVIEALKGTTPYFDTIGDCVKPANVTQAVFRGHFAAIDI